jgi:hypothetical protein
MLRSGMVCDVCRELMQKWAEAERELFAVEALIIDRKHWNAAHVEQCQARLSLARHEYERSRLEFLRHRTAHAEAKIT